MRKLFFALICSLGCFLASAQFTYKIKADSLLVTNDSCTAELNLENSTKHVKGFLFNKGKGRTEFRKALEYVEPGVYLIGSDTLRTGSSLSAWNLAGNSGTNASSDFLGTIDSQHLVFRTRNLERARFTATGNLLLGTTIDNAAKFRIVTPVTSTAMSLEPDDLGNSVLDHYTGLKIRANLASDAGYNRLISLEHVNPAAQQTLNIPSSFLLYSKGGWNGTVSYAGIPALGGFTVGADSAGTGPWLALKVKSPLATGTEEWVGYFGGFGSPYGVGAAQFINSAFSTVNTGDFLTKYGVRIESTGELHNTFNSTATNYGLHIESKDADINYGVYINSGMNYMADKLGLGTTTPQHTLDVNGTARFQKAIYYTVKTDIGNASYSVADTDHYIELPELTVSRTLTLPTASAQTGRRLTIKNKNSSGFQWSFSTAVKDKQDNDLTNLSNDTVYEIISNGTSWVVINLY